MDQSANNSDGCDGAQDALNKMARAHRRGTGCHLTADEIHSLSVTLIGQWWEQPDPRKQQSEPNRPKENYEQD